MSKSATIGGATITDGQIVTTQTALPATTVELGHASDTTLARKSAGVISVEGCIVPMAIASISPVTVTNTVTETEILSVVIPAGMLGTLGQCLIEGVLGFTNTTGVNRTYTRRVKVNGTTVAAAVSAALANGNDRVAIFRWLFQNNGATNANFMCGEYNTGGGTVVTGIGAPLTSVVVQDNHSSGQTALTIDTTAAVTISVTIELSTNSTSLSFYQRGASATVKATV